MTRTVLVSVAIVVGLLVAGCDSKDTAESTSTTSSAESPSAETREAPRAAKSDEPSEPLESVDSYVKDNGITETEIPPGTPDAPQLTVPVPAGWIELPRDKPTDPWGTLMLDETKGFDLPTMIGVSYLKYSEPVDPAKILELAPNTVKEMPDYDGPNTAEPSQVSGFDAVDIAGAASHEGHAVYVIQRTVVIPRDDGVYVLNFAALGAPEREPAITQAMTELGSSTRIEP